jgi:hypothetical protein
MNEFKGTQQFKVSYSTTSNLVYKYEVASIQETDIEAKANALLISKAPEMLEMLESIVDGTAFDKESGLIWKHRLQLIEQLIKEVTEL